MTYGTEQATTTISEARDAIASGDAATVSQTEAGYQVAQTRYLRSIALSLVEIAEAARADQERYAESVARAKELGVRL